MIIDSVMLVFKVGLQAIWRNKKAGDERPSFLCSVVAVDSCGGIIPVFECLCMGLSQTLTQGAERQNPRPFVVSSK